MPGRSPGWGLDHGSQPSPRASPGCARGGPRQERRCINEAKWHGARRAMRSQPSLPHPQSCPSRENARLTPPKFRMPGSTCRCWKCICEVRSGQSGRASSISLAVVLVFFFSFLLFPFPIFFLSFFFPSFSSFPSFLFSLSLFLRLSAIWSTYVGTARAIECYSPSGSYNSATPSSTFSFLSAACAAHRVPVPGLE